jgi:hypothetical protein
VVADIFVTLNVPDEYFQDQDIYMSFNFHSSPYWQEEEDGEETTFCDARQSVLRQRRLKAGTAVHLYEKVKVEESGKEFLSFAFCGSTQNCPTCTISFQGNFVFKNPYGFLRAAEFGLLPYSTCLCLAYALSMLLFAYMYWSNLESVHSLQKMVLGVLFVSTVSSFVWVYTYYNRNATGTPECCPYTDAVIASHVFEIFSITSLRVLILCVCLGFGVQPEPLGKATVAKIAVLTLYQFIVSVVATALDTQNRSHARYDPEAVDSKTGFFFFLSRVGEIVYIIWVWAALTTTMKSLERSGQTYKLSMFKSLRGGLCVIAVFYLFAEMLQILASVEALQWAWDAAWLLNPAIFWWSAQYATVMILCWIWRPNETASLYASSSQLATTDEEEADEQKAENSGLEMTNRMEAASDAAWQAEMVIQTLPLSLTPNPHP